MRSSTDAIFGGIVGGIKRRRRNAIAAKLRHLIAHQRDQRRHHDGQAVAEKRRKLVAQRLAAAGRHDRQHVAALEDGGNDLGLAGPERLEAEGCAKRSLCRREVRHIRPHGKCSIFVLRRRARVCLGPSYAARDALSCATAPADARWQTTPGFPPMTSAASRDGRSAGRLIKLMFAALARRRRHAHDHSRHAAGDPAGARRIAHVGDAGRAPDRTAACDVRHRRRAGIAAHRADRHAARGHPRHDRSRRSPAARAARRSMCGRFIAAAIATGFGVAIMQPGLPTLVREWLPRRIALGTIAYTSGMLMGAMFATVLTIPIRAAAGRRLLAARSRAVGGAGAPDRAGIFSAEPERRRSRQVRRQAIGGLWWPDWKDPLVWLLGLTFGSNNSAYFSHQCVSRRLPRQPRKGRNCLARLWDGSTARRSWLPIILLVHGGSPAAACLAVLDLRPSSAGGLSWTDVRAVHCGDHRLRRTDRLHHGDHADRDAGFAAAAQHAGRLCRAPPPACSPSATPGRSSSRPSAARCGTRPADRGRPLCRCASAR